MKRRRIIDCDELEQTKSDCLRDAIFFGEEFGIDSIADSLDPDQLLEDIVISGNVQSIQAIATKKNKNQDLLGLACRYNTKEAVQVLVEKGFCFHHDIDNKYCAEVALSYATFPAQLVNRSYMYPKINRNEERTRIVEYLLDHRESKFMPEWLLFHAMAAGDRYMVDLLKGKGIALDDVGKRFFVKDKESLMKFTTLARSLGRMCPRQKAYVMETMGKEGDLAFDMRMLMDDEEINDPIVMKGIMHCRKRQGITRDEIYEILLEMHDMEILNMPELTNWVRNLNDLECLEELVNKKKDPALSAWFLAFGDKYYDHDLLVSRREKRMNQILNMSVDTQTYQSKFYRLKKEDGGYTILGYKGKETKVVIPGTISGLPVKRIGDEAFSPWQSRISSVVEKTRREIESVTIPEGVESIGKECFDRCEKLRELNLPKTLVDMSCGIPKSLEKLVIPEHVEKIDEYALRYSNLREITFLGNTRVECSRYSYSKPEKLRLIKGPSGSNAEEYARKRYIHFEVVGK